MAVDVRNQVRKCIFNPVRKCNTLCMYFLHIARFFAAVLSFLTPAIILGFLFYSPICKKVFGED